MGMLIKLVQLVSFMNNLSRGLLITVSVYYSCCVIDSYCFWGDKLDLGEMLSHEISFGR